MDRMRGDGANGASVSATALRPARRTVRVEAHIPESSVDEFELLMLELFTGKRERALTLERERATIQAQAVAALEVIITAVRAHPGTGQARRLVQFLAGVYCGSDYPFDLSELRGLETKLANACLDYLNYDRLGIRDLDRHLGGYGRRELRGWIRQYEIRSRG
jgi:hypothetical protein